MSETTLTEGGVYKGAAKWFDTTKGFGFIIPDAGGADIFVHQSELHIETEPKKLFEGQRVSFTLVSDGGKFKATQVGSEDGTPISAHPSISNPEFAKRISANPNIKFGKCKWFDTKKGFGFIIPDGQEKEVFVHQSEISSTGFRGLAENQSVEFEISITQENGKEVKKCVNVTGPGGQPVNPPEQPGSAALISTPFGSVYGAQPVLGQRPGQLSGKVKWFNAEKGYGFILPSDGSPEIFCHQSSVVGGDPLSILVEGNAVDFQVETKDGKPRTANVTQAGAGIAYAPARIAQIPGAPVFVAPAGYAPAPVYAQNPYTQPAAPTQLIGKRKTQWDEQSAYKIARTQGVPTTTATAYGQVAAYGQAAPVAAGTTAATPYGVYTQQPQAAQQVYGQPAYAQPLNPQQPAYGTYPQYQ